MSELNIFTEGTTLAKRMRSVAAVLRTLDESAKSEIALAEMEGSNHE